MRRGSARRRVLYDRSVQRRHERWPLAGRILAAAFSHPEAVLSLFGSPPPIERDGRILSRGVQALLEVVTRFDPQSGSGRQELDSIEPEVLRAGFERMVSAVMPIRTDVHVTGRVIRGVGDEPAIALRIYRQFGTALPAPDGRRPPVIVYYHGGGWVIGSLASHDASCRLLAVASGCIVVSVDYRLAPESPFPAAVDDALRAYRWVHGHLDELGAGSGRVGVMGDSAGGNLAAVVALATRDSSDGTPPPVAQGLVYPAVDFRLETASVETFRDGFFLTRAQMDFFRACYLPDSDRWLDPLASPLLAADHADLAPALVATAGFDPLRDEGMAYAATLRAAGVEVVERCYDDQVHGFMGMGILPDALAVATEVGDAMGRLMRRADADASWG